MRRTTGLTTIYNCLPDCFRRNRGWKPILEATVQSPIDSSGTTCSSLGTQRASDELTAPCAADELMSSARANHQKSWEKQEAVVQKGIRSLRQHKNRRDSGIDGTLQVC
jgi:hypothetical protein